MGTGVHLGKGTTCLGEMTEKKKREDKGAKSYCGKAFSGAQASDIWVAGIAWRRKNS